MKSSILILILFFALPLYSQSRLRLDSLKVDQKVIIKNKDRTPFFDNLSDENETTTSSIGDSTVPLQKFTPAAYDFIGSGGSISNNPDDVTLETKPGNTIGIKDTFSVNSIGIQNNLSVGDTLGVTGTATFESHVKIGVGYNSFYTNFFGNNIWTLPGIVGMDFLAVNDSIISGGRVQFDSTLIVDDEITASDGISIGSGNIFNVTKHGSNPVIQGTTEDTAQSYPPSVIVYQDTFFAIVKSNHKLWGLYSLDGITWVDYGEVMNSGFNSWGVGLSESELQYDPNTGLFHLWYTANYGPTSYDSSAVGHATSTRPLSGYVADPNNPIMRPETINDLYGTGYMYTSMGNVIKVGSTYIYYFAMRENNLGDNAFSSIFCATSDSLNGSPTFKNFIFHGTVLPNRSGNSLFTPAVVRHNGIFWMLFYNGEWQDETSIYNDEGDLFMAYGGPYEFKPIQTPFLENSTVDQSWDERRVYMAKFLKEQDGTWLTPKKINGSYRVYYSGFGENIDINHGYTGIAEFTQFPNPYGIEATDRVGGIQSNIAMLNMTDTRGVELFSIGGNPYLDTLITNWYSLEDQKLSMMIRRNGHTEHTFYGSDGTSRGYIYWSFGGNNPFIGLGDNTNEFWINKAFNMGTEIQFGYKDSTYSFKTTKAGRNFIIGGKLGIGSITPGEEITVYNATYPYTQFINDVSGTTINDGSHIGLDAATANLTIIQKEAAKLQFYTSNTVRATIGATGLFGIGTVSPLEELSIYAPVYPYIHIFNNTTGSTSNDGSTFGVGGTTQDFQIINREAAKMQFFTSNVARATIGATGLFGIGTVSPLEELSIYATTYPYIQITNSNTGTTINDGSHIGVGGTTQDLQIVNKESSKIDMFTANTSRFVISASGMNGTPTQTVTLGVGATTLEITSNVINLTGDGGGNTITTLSGGIAGGILTIVFNDALITITNNDAHTANTVDLSAAFTSADDTVLQLVYVGGSWYEISRSVN